MNIDDQIKDEKLKYNINREATKISALSSGEIRKYKYLTGEDILPSNQQQIIEQAKFTYSPLGKAFDKQIKTIKDQGDKQVKALKFLEPKSIENEFSKQSINQDIYNKIFEERIDEILEISKKINYANLVYDFKGSTPPINFINFEGPMYTYNQLKNGDKTLQQVEEEQKHFKKDLNEIKSGNPRDKSEKQLYTIKNVKNFMTQDKKLLICLMIIQKLDLKLSTNQNKTMQLKEKDLKY